MVGAGAPCNCLISTLPSKVQVMQASLPLLSRLRHRSLGVGGLCMLLVLVKLALATGCLAVDSVLAPAVAAATMRVSEPGGVAAAHGGVESCWHAGIDGCHYHCVHTLPLAGHASVRIASLRAASSFVAMLPALNSPPTRNELRPLVV